jgi:YgiT-type zinc finger domain-containing protein
MKVCFFCNTEMELENLAFMAEMNGSIVVIKNVPTSVCERCGQKSYSNEVAKRIEQITNSLRTAVTEVAIVHYAEKTAA